MGRRKSEQQEAWRCADSRSLARFLGYEVTRKTPHHSSLTKMHPRLPLSVHEEGFTFVLQIAGAEDLLNEKTVAVYWLRLSGA